MLQKEKAAIYLASKKELMNDFEFGDIVYCYTTDGVSAYRLCRIELNINEGLKLFGFSAKSRQEVIMLPYAWYLTVNEDGILTDQCYNGCWYGTYELVDKFVYLYNKMEPLELRGKAITSSNNTLNFIRYQWYRNQVIEKTVQPKGVYGITEAGYYCYSSEFYDDSLIKGLNNYTTYSACKSVNKPIIYTFDDSPEISNPELESARVAYDSAIVALQAAKDKYEKLLQ